MQNIFYTALSCCKTACLSKVTKAVFTELKMKVLHSPLRTEAT